MITSRGWNFASGVTERRTARLRGLHYLIAVAAFAWLSLPALARAWVPGRSGQIAYESTESQPGDSGYFHIWVINPDGSDKRELTHGPFDEDPSWSPNGRAIAFSRFEGGIGSRIWVMSNTGADQRPLTPAGTPGDVDPEAGGNFLPRYSPDGTRIAFVSRVFQSGRDEASQVWVMNSDGSDRHQITDFPVADIRALTWSPDSSHLLFWATDIVHPSTDSYGNANAPFHIYEMTSEGGDVHQIAYDPRPLFFVGIEGTQVGGLDWGPRGIAFGVPDGIHVAAHESDGSPSLSIGDALGPTWAPDGADPWIAYYRVVDGQDQLFTAGQHEQQLTFDGSGHFNPSWGPATRYTRSVIDRVPLVAVEQPVEHRSRGVLVLLTCPLMAGADGCLERLIVGVGSGARSSKTYRLAAGKSRPVSFRESKRLVRSLDIGGHLRLALHSKMRGRALVQRRSAPVFAPASVSANCPGARTGFGSPITLSGVLHKSPATAGAPAAGAHAKVGMVVMSGPGLAGFVTGTTDGRGRYKLTFRPIAPGHWKMQVIWNGDRHHASAQSRGCTVLVKPPPPVKTTLTVSCQPGTVGSPLDVSGSLSPNVSGEVKLSYRRGGKAGGGIVDTVSTTSQGWFVDHPVAQDAGTWTVVASYAGDPGHRATTSSACSFTVSPVVTKLTLSCPSTATQNKAMQVTGAISPALRDAQITLTYTHKTPKETFTSSVTTDSTGGFTDTSIKPNDPGEWDVVASYAGDANHKSSTSQACATQVS